MKIKTNSNKIPHSIVVDGVEFVQKITEPKRILEYIYLIDNSGSAPIDTYLDLLEELLEIERLNTKKLNKFNVIPFNGSPIFAESVYLNKFVNEKTFKYIRRWCTVNKHMHTDINSVIKKVHSIPKDKRFERIVIVITDGIL